LILTSADLLENVVAEDIFRVFLSYQYNTDYIGHMVVMLLKMLKNWQVWNYFRTPCGFSVIIGNG